MHACTQVTDIKAPPFTKPYIPPTVTRKQEARRAGCWGAARLQTGSKGSNVGMRREALYKCQMLYIQKNHSHQVCWHHHTDTCYRFHHTYTYAHTWSPSLPQLWNSAVIYCVSSAFAHICLLKTHLYSLRHCRFMLPHVINVSTSLMTPLTCSLGLMLTSLRMHAVSASHKSTN